jgi:hypothetical protein
MRHGALDHLAAPKAFGVKSKVLMRAECVCWIDPSRYRNHGARDVPGPQQPRAHWRRRILQAFATIRTRCGPGTSRAPGVKIHSMLTSAPRHNHPIRCVWNMWSAVATPKAFGGHRFKGSQAGTRSQSAVAAPLCRRTPYGGSIKVHFTARARQKAASHLTHLTYLTHLTPLAYSRQWNQRKPT